MQGSRIFLPSPHHFRLCAHVLTMEVISRHFVVYKGTSPQPLDFPPASQADPKPVCRTPELREPSVRSVSHFQAFGPECPEDSTCGVVRTGRDQRGRGLQGGPDTSGGRRTWGYSGVRTRKGKALKKPSLQPPENPAGLCPAQPPSSYRCTAGGCGPQDPKPCGLSEPQFGGL